MAQLGWQAWLTLAVLVACLGLMATERLSPARALIGAMLVLLLSGVLTLEQALAGFHNPGVVTVALLFVPVAALRSTGAVRWIGAWVLGRPGRIGPGQARLVVAAAGLSAFINNTPVVAMLLSASEHWARASGVAVSKMLLTMNYATVVGGMCTLIGTSTNLIVAGLVLAAGLPALDMFDPLRAGLPVLAVALVYLATAGRWLSPVRQSTVQRAAREAAEYAVEVQVTAHGGLAGRTVAEAGLRQLRHCYLVEICAVDGTPQLAGPDSRLQSGDTLVFIGGSEAALELRGHPGLTAASGHHFSLDEGHGELQLVEVVLAASARVTGLQLRQSGFRDHYGAAVLALSRHGRRVPGKLGDLVLQAGDTLLLEARPDFVERFGASRDFMALTPVEAPAPVDSPRAAFTLTVLAAMVLANAVLGVPILLSALAAAILVLLARCVRVDELRRSMDFGLLLAIASAFALGAAMQVTGLAAALAGSLQALAHSDPFWTLVAVYVGTVLITELVTNNAAAVLMFPVGLGSAQLLGVDSMPFVMAVMIGASAGFLTPIGYQTNLMVYGPGGYRFIDYLRVGLPLSLLVGLAAMLAIPWAWPFAPTP